MRFSLISFFILAFASQLSAQAKPNIIFVLFDDLGYGQPQCYQANSSLCTPNLDKLASEGMRFTDAHTAAAVCTPTRYGVLTGRYPARLGQFGVLTTFSKPIIPPNRMTVASMLKQQGYATACVGKWHLGMNWGKDNPGSEKEVPIDARMTGGPNTIGFDYFYGFTHARNIGTIIEQDQVVSHVKSVENQPLMLKKAIEWLEQRKTDEPFFLYFPLGIPHEPIEPAAEFVGKSEAQDLVKNDPKYGDWLYQGDAMLGKLIEALDRKNLAENTLIIATSDNGAEHRSYEPLRDSKRSIYEGGHRVPFIARWPGKVKPGSINHHTICLNDLMATAAEISGATLPDEAGEDSVSLIPELLATSITGVREATIHQSASADLAIRQGPWKLIFMKDGSRKLYNLDTDLSEAQNILATNSEIAKDLTMLMERYISTRQAKPAKKGKKLNSQGKTKTEHDREMALASDASFD